MLIIQPYRSHKLILEACTAEWLACDFFQHVPIFVQTIRTLLFIIRFIKLTWYKKKEDIQLHLLNSLTFMDTVDFYKRPGSV